MGSPFAMLNALKSNILGGGGTGTTSIIPRNSAIEMADTSPTSALDVDPYQFTGQYSDILNGMFNDGQAQGMYGFPGFNFGLQPQSFSKLAYPQPNYFNVGN